MNTREARKAALTLIAGWAQSAWEAGAGNLSDDADFPYTSLDHMLESIPKSERRDAANRIQQALVIEIAKLELKGAL